MNDLKIKVTPVFDWNHDAIHAVNPDGTRKYRYIINEGSSRSSKTRSLIQITHKYCNQNNGKRVSVWRETKKNCRDTVGDDVRRTYPGLPLSNYIQFNKTEAVYLFPSGSTFELNGTDDSEKIHGYNGHVTWLNEPYQISRETFDQLDMRTEDFIIIDWNPKKAHWIDDLKKNERAIVIKSTFKDNPFCPPEQKIKILSYQPVGHSQCVLEKIITEAEAKQYDITKNHLNLTTKQLAELARCKENERTGSASAFNWQVYGLGEKAEKPNRIFHWTEISDDDYNKIDAKEYYGVDWGVVDPWGILKCKYYDGALYFHELNYKSENEWRADLLPVEREQVDKQDEGLVRWLFTKLHIPKSSIIVCDNNRQEKIIALRMAGWDYAIEAIKGPGSIIAGISLLQEMRCFYTSSSKNIAYEQENYEWEVDRYGKQLEDPIDTDNHIAGDPPRYIATFLKLQGIIKKI